MDKPKYKTCRYATNSGQNAVYVTPNCPKARMIKGNLVVYKKWCENCRSYKEKITDRSLDNISTDSGTPSDKNKCHGCFGAAAYKIKI